jgi:D-glycero-D-manno-heptose 1,7-bisphosphate phosphatase
MNEDVGYLASIDELFIYPWTFEAVRLLNDSNLPVVVVTNQSGVARGICTEPMLEKIHSEFVKRLADQGARIDAIYYCPHHPRIGNQSYRRDCNCRKPKPGMLEAAALEHDLHLSRSFVVGDKASDMDLATKVGATPVLVLTGYGAYTRQNLEHCDYRPAIIADDLLGAVKAILGRLNSG